MADYKGKENSNSEKLEETLKLLRKIKDWYWSELEDLSEIQQYFNTKYDIFNKLCDTVDVALSVWFDWEVEDLTKEVFMQIDKSLGEDYIEDKWVLAKWVSILEGNLEVIKEELKFMRDFKLVKEEKGKAKDDLDELLWE